MHMNELLYLKDLVIILGLGVIIAAVFYRFRLPAIAGFIFAGIVAGPKGLGLMEDMGQVQIFSEVGVTLLLFGIGLELPMNRLRRLWRPVLIGGLIQVSISIVATMLIARSFGLSTETSLITGFVIAASSTAIVLKGLEQRGEVDAPHGRLTVGILIFQDLCVVPMMLIIPLLGNSTGTNTSLTSTIIRSAAIVTAVVVAGRILVPKVMDIIARTRQRHLFIMTVLLICLGTAWISAHAGVSLALGAFLAGFIVAGSEYRHQALADIISFKEVFISLFFISIGMLLDLRAIFANAVPIVILLAGIIIGKFLIVLVTALLMRLPLRVSVMSSMALAQVGEFSFVLMSTAAGYRLIDDPFAGNLTAAIVLSMLITPLFLQIAPTLAASMGKIKILSRLFGISAAEEIVDTARTMQNHVIIGGYGLAGHDLALALKECNIPYLIVELNPENIHKAAAKGEPIYFGDITSVDVLKRLGAQRAKEFVVVINDPDAIERAVKAARSIAPHLHILVRIRYIMDTKNILAAGASDVVPAELEAAVEVTARVLKRHHIQSEKIDTQFSRIRERRSDEVA